MKITYDPNKNARNIRERDLDFEKQPVERPKPVEKPLPYIDKEGEVRELDAADFAKFRPAHEVLPDSLKKKLGVRGPQKALLKVPTTIRVDADLLEAMRASGKGWQTRANDALRDWMRGQGTL